MKGEFKNHQVKTKTSTKTSMRIHSALKILLFMVNLKDMQCSLSCTVQNYHVHCCVVLFYCRYTKVDIPRLKGQTNPSILWPFLYPASSGGKMLNQLTALDINYRQNPKDKLKCPLDRRTVSSINHVAPRTGQEYKSHRSPDGEGGLQQNSF